MLLKLTDLLVRDGLGLDPATRLGGTVQFFIYDTVKIFLLLAVTLSFLITSPIINEYLVVLMAGTFGVPVTIAFADYLLNAIAPLL